MIVRRQVSTEHSRSIRLYFVTMASLHPNQPSASFLHGSIALGVLTLVATGFVVMRFVQRLKTLELGVDDYLVLSALVFCIGIFINTVLSTMPNIGGGGYHITEYTFDQLNTFCKVSFSIRSIIPSAQRSSELTKNPFGGCSFRSLEKSCTTVRLHYPAFLCSCFTNVYSPSMAST